MKYALERLDRFVEGELNPDRLNGYDEHVVAEFVLRIERELGMVRSFLLRRTVEYTREKALELLVQQCQAGMVDLLDRVYGYRLRYEGHWLEAAYERIMGLLEGMLTQIERRYTKYFNQEANVPRLYLKMMQLETGEQYRVLKGARRFRELDAELVRMVMDPVHLFSKDKWGTAITYSRMIYIKELVRELMETADGQGVYRDNDLILQLVYLNFNTPEMVRCIISLMLTEVNLLKDVALQEERLGYWHKELSQCLVKPGVAIVRDYTSLKQQLIGWVAEELQYFERQQQQRLFVEPRWQPEHKTSVGMLSMNLPVQCLGMLIRAATEEGLVMNESVEGAIEKASRIFTTPGTKKTNGPSSESMRIKSYNPSKKEKDRVIEPLYGMIRRISKY